MNGDEPEVSPLKRALETNATLTGSQETATGEQDRDYLCLRIGTRLFAVGVESVREVVPLPSFTPVPHTPAHIPGVFGVRGRVVAVFDLAAFINEKNDTKPDRVVVVGAGVLEAAIPVTAVVGLQTVNASQLRPPLSDMSDLGGFVQGYYVKDEIVYLIVNVELLLSASRPKAKATA